ncbi:MAG TPA: PilZ domain-containing protein [Pyrinomonadaceae bacterium]|nr:PilZ domain-containing protein [Pyrinomonadaceae bacterium]
MKKSAPLTFKDRRKYPRIKYSLTVDWGETPACANQGEVTTLSVGGCFLQTPLEVAQGKLIFIRLLLAPKSANEMEGIVWGRVAYHKPGLGLGVEFKKLPPDYAEHIADIVEFNLGSGEDA